MNTAFEITTSAVPPGSDAVVGVYVSVWSSARSNSSVSASPEPDFVATVVGAELSDTDQLSGKLDTAPSRKFDAVAGMTVNSAAVSDARRKVRIAFMAVRTFGVC